MSARVLLVDDSAVIRELMARALSAEPGIEIAGEAADGRAAVEMAAKLHPDIIILDIEMPVMDGITALPELLKVSPASKIIIASMLTLRNAEISLKALELGAADYLPKPSAQTGHQTGDFFRELIAKINALTASPAAITLTPPSPQLPMPAVHAIAIAASTGGPQAIISLLGQLKGRLLHIPIFITQHMPPTFTTILAEHIGKASERICIEVKGGEVVTPGFIYLAQGDYHMAPEKTANGEIAIRINQNPPENFCRPSANPMFRALSAIYGRHLLAVVLTGMGHDGVEGARMIVNNGGSVIAQDEATSVVYGMPKAVAEEHLCRAILSLQEIGGYVLKQTEGASMMPERFKVLAGILKKRSGFTLTEDKIYLAENRLLPVAHMHGLRTVNELCRIIQNSADEALLSDVTEAMTTNESSFFRDNKPFEALRQIIFPMLMEKKSQQKSVRMWSAACSTGQEAYSIAICVEEEREKMPDWYLHILGTDLSHKALTRATQGNYSQFEVERGLPPKLLLKYFTHQEDGSWQAEENIRSLIKYKEHNLIGDYTPLGKFDIIFCRNVLIYFDDELKAEITAKMARALNPYGVLIIGSTETLTDPKGQFIAIDNFRGGYRLK